MITYKFLPVHKIITTFKEDIPLEKAKKTISDKNPSIEFQIVVEEYDGRFYLVGGFTLFQALKRVKVKDRIPCRMVDSSSSTLAEIILKQLQRGIDLENTSWRFKYNRIDALINDYHVDVSTIAKFLNKDVAFVQNHILYKEIPDYYKERAIATGTSGLVNEIYLHPAIPDSQKEQFYRLAVTRAITYLELYLTTSYFHFGYDGLYAYPFPLHRSKQP